MAEKYKKKHQIGPANSQLYQLDMANKQKHRIAPTNSNSYIANKTMMTSIESVLGQQITSTHHISRTWSSVDIDSSVKWGSLEMGLGDSTLLCPVFLFKSCQSWSGWVFGWDSAEDYRTQCEPVVVPRDPGWITHPEHHFHPHHFDQDNPCCSHCLYRHCYCHDHHHQCAWYCPKGSLSGLLNHP